MTEVSKKLKNMDNWIVIELNSTTDLLESLLSKLNSNKLYSNLIKIEKIDLSFFDFGIGIKGSHPIMK